ncbi:MAG TPA: hypothetical protein VF746_08465 [Longimicrobium sp.]
MIIAGPNGAGKSTLAPSLLVGELEVGTFVNADVIAQGLAGFDPASAAIQAGRIVLERLDGLRRAGADFAFETTLSGLSLQRTIHDLHDSGDSTDLFYLWLPDPEMAVNRVRQRVRLGGHSVPEEDIRRRYFRSIRNFDMVYRRIVSRWWLYQAFRPLELPEPPLIAKGTGESIMEIRDAQAWEQIQIQSAEGERRGRDSGAQP